MTTRASGALARFQDAFAHALLTPDCEAPAEIAALAVQPGFAVYRNTVVKGCIDALQANYPAATRLVGEEWFRAAAAIYVRAEPPAEPMLMRYGARFADFLAGFEPAAELPYLPDVARLDRYWTEAHCAPTATALDPVALAHRSAEALADTFLVLHPAARWRWFADAPIYSIWSRNREEDCAESNFDWRGEGALLTRPDGVVQWIELDAAGCAFLDACAAGATLAKAAEASLQARSDADLARLMATLLGTGAFCDLQDAHSLAENPT